MEEAGQLHNVQREHLLVTKVRSYIVHLLSTYVSGTIRWNCRLWMMRPRFTSSLDVRGISCHRSRDVRQAQQLDLYRRRVLNNRIPDEDVRQIRPHAQFIYA